MRYEIFPKARNSDTEDDEDKDSESSKDKDEAAKVTQSLPPVVRPLVDRVFVYDPLDRPFVGDCGLTRDTIVSTLSRMPPIGGRTSSGTGAIVSVASQNDNHQIWSFWDVKKLKQFMDDGHVGIDVTQQMASFGTGTAARAGPPPPPPGAPPPGRPPPPPRPPPSVSFA